jgi:DNA gyrase subunit B
LYGKTEIGITGEDVREGMVYAVAVKLSNAKFHGQTKDSLGSREAQSVTQTLSNQFFESLINEQPNLAKTIATRIVAAAKGRLAAKKARETARKSTLEGGNLGLPVKLKDCISTDPAESELWVTEGNSASGSAEAGRDVNTQAILALRGKILNTHDEDISRILKNAEIQSIIAALGCGIGEAFDISKLRYHKIISMTDADVDGSHIKSLLLTFFHQYYKPLIEGGFIYYANSPLYIVKQGSKILGYLKDETEKERFILRRAKQLYKDVKRYSDLTHQQIANCTQKLKFNYIKGLGEMNPEELALTTMNKDKRTLTQVTMEDAEEAAETFRVLMDSKSVEERKEFIQENALEANLDI